MDGRPADMEHCQNTSFQLCRDRSIAWKGLKAMFKIGMTFNGKKITSSSQLKREFENAARKAAGKALDDHVRRAAPPGVRVSKTLKGYKLEGPEAKVERTLRKLGHK